MVPYRRVEAVMHSPSRCSTYSRKCRGKHVTLLMAYSLYVGDSISRIKMHSLKFLFARVFLQW